MKAGSEPAIPSQEFFLWKHYNELPAGWAAGPCDKVCGSRQLRTTWRPGSFSNGLFRTAIAAAHPSSCLPPHLPPAPRSGRLIVLAAGKAAGSMAEVAEAAYADLPPDRLTGIAVARQGYGRPTRIIPMIEAGHPIPDAAGLQAAERALKLAERRGPDDLVLVLLSGGASANWIAPVEGLSLADKQAVTRALLRSGANIGEINTVRKHLSRIKGGRLGEARAACTRADAGDFRRARRRSRGDRLGADACPIRRRSPMLAPSSRDIELELPEVVTRALADPGNETPKPGDPVFADTEFKLIARPADAFRAARAAMRAARLRVRHARRPYRGRGARRRRRARRPGAGAANGRAAAPSSCPAAS